MEHVMDLPCLGKAELICDRGEDLDNCEGSFMFWSRLWVGNGILEVSGFQPDFISFSKEGESLVVM